MVPLSRARRLLQLKSGYRREALRKTTPTTTIVDNSNAARSIKTNRTRRRSESGSCSSRERKPIKAEDRTKRLKIEDMADRRDTSSSYRHNPFRDILESQIRSSNNMGPPMVDLERSPRPLGAARNNSSPDIQLLGETSRHGDGRSHLANMPSTYYSRRGPPMDGGGMTVSELMDEQRRRDNTRYSEKVEHWGTPSVGNANSFPDVSSSHPSGSYASVLRQPYLGNSLHDAREKRVTFPNHNSRSDSHLYSDRHSKDAPFVDLRHSVERNPSPPRHHPSSSHDPKRMDGSMDRARSPPGIPKRDHRLIDNSPPTHHSSPARRRRDRSPMVHSGESFRDPSPARHLLRSPTMVDPTHDTFPLVSSDYPPMTAYGAEGLSFNSIDPSPSAAKNFKIDERHRDAYKPTPIAELNRAREAKRLAVDRASSILRGGSLVRTSDDDLAIVEVRASPQSSNSIMSHRSLDRNLERNRERAVERDRRMRSADREDAIRGRNVQERRSFKCEPGFERGPPPMDATLRRPIDQFREQPPLDVSLRRPIDHFREQPAPSGESACKWKRNGCPVVTSTVLLARHENKCLFNPLNGKEQCPRCLLAFSERHDCVESLKRELQEEILKERRTRVYSDMRSQPAIIEQAYVKVLERDQTERLERIELRRGDTGEDVLRLVIARLNARDETIGGRRLIRQWLEYQLVFQGLTIIRPDSQLDAPKFLPPEPRFLLVQRVIEIGLKVCLNCFTQRTASYSHTLCPRLDRQNVSK